MHDPAGSGKPHGLKLANEDGRLFLYHSNVCHAMFRNTRTMHVCHSERASLDPDSRQQILVKMLCDGTGAGMLSRILVLRMGNVVLQF